MLIKVKIKNVFSIGECEIDFMRGRFGFKKEMIYQEKYVNPLAIYGYNGSGKSAFINAMGFIVSFMNEGETISLEPNLLLEEKMRKEHIDMPYLISYIEISFSVGNNYYLYKLQYCAKKVLKEVLILNNVKIMERSLNSVMLLLHYDSYKEVKNVNKSALLEFRDIFTEAYDYLSQMVYIADHRTNSIAKVLLERDIYQILVKYSTQINEIISRVPNTYSYKIINEKGIYYILINDEMRLPIRYLSNGMFNECLLIALILLTREDGIIFVDEIERSLHPFIIQELLQLLKEKHIQLVFTSHNTHLMSLLRPDQIYFASFDGIKTNFNRLSNLESNIREVNNIEKMYLSFAFHKKD